MQLEAGQVFGRYTIEHVLGEGGMGRVYRAADTKLLRRVALKILSSDAEGTDGAALVLREARAAAAITHENAVTIFDVGEVDGVPYIAMEYVKGEPLRAFVGDLAVPLEERLGWLASIARALATAHEGGLVHRDVKPENVLIREDGVVKVLDFGIAHHQTLGSLRAIATTSSALLTGAADTQISGTPAYMAPEQLRGEKIDGRADQFAWGLVAWELIAGKHPNEAKNITALIAQRLSKSPPLLRSIGLAIPEYVEQVVARALSKDPEDRFPSMSELVLALTQSEPRASAPRSSPRAPSALEAAPTETAASIELATKPKHRGHSRWLAVTAIVTLALAGTAIVAARRSSSSAQPTAVTDLPVPTSAKLDAVAEYKAGLQSARDGAGSEARVHFVRAVEIDPTMASAQVWIASLSAFQNRSQARAALDRARQQRAALTERDARWLACLEPLLDRDPADLVASERLCDEASRAFPRDAHLRLQLAIVRAARGDRAALPDADAALALDPKYVAASLVRGLALESFGEDEGALITYERCVADNPASASCFAGELKLLSRKGQCEKVDEEAKRWTVSHPSDPEAFRQRAIFLSARYESRDSVTELLATSRSHLPSTARPRRENTDRLALALFAGDLPSAKAAAEKLGADATDIAEHGEAALALVEIHDELGKPEEAGRLAAEFLKRRDLWAGAARMDQDPTALLAARAHRAKLISPEEAAKTRDEWMTRWSTRGRAGERWLLGYAAGVDTPEDAASALSALPRFMPLPALPDLRLAAGLGHVHLLGGRVDDAIPALESAVRDCAVLRAPITHARALLWLGDAYAKRGDKAKACEALSRVGKMWLSTSTNPTPVTLERARAAMTREGCSAP